MKKYTFHTDPSHGWLEVPRAALTKLGIEHKITDYSYQLGDRVYLEEDGDFSTFVRASMEAMGLERNEENARRWMKDHIDPSEKHTAYSPVRAYERYAPSVAVPAEVVEMHGGAA
jgi:hypothetical protein